MEGVRSEGESEDGVEGVRGREGEREVEETCMVSRSKVSRKRERKSEGVER